MLKSRTIATTAWYQHKPFLHGLGGRAPPDKNGSSVDLVLQSPARASGAARLHDMLEWQEQSCGMICGDKDGLSCEFVQMQLTDLNVNTTLNGHASRDELHLCILPLSTSGSATAVAWITEGCDDIQISQLHLWNMDWVELGPTCNTCSDQRQQAGLTSTSPSVSSLQSPSWPPHTQPGQPQPLL